MAIMLGGAAFHAAQQAQGQDDRIAAHQFGCGESAVAMMAAPYRPRVEQKFAWADTSISRTEISICCPKTGAGAGSHPRDAGADRRPVCRKTVGCRCTRAIPSNFISCWLRSIRTAREARIRRYVIGHDCGTVINPHIVKGMTLGGIAHGIGASLLEEFVYDGEGQLMTQSFMDYLLPSSHEVPKVEIVHHCTPSPFTVFGQKGSGESGYLGSPAAISGALNDAVRRCGISFEKLPIRISAISDAIAAAHNLGKVQT